MNGRAFLTAALFCAAALVGPYAVEAQDPPPEPTTTVPSGTTARDIMLRPGDVVRISVWPDPDRQLAGEFAIQETGYLHLPLIQEVRATGISVSQLREELRRRYGEAVRNPVVTVTPLFRITITGEVMRPGAHMITPAHELFDVIGMAGGFRPNADMEKVRIVRPGEVIDFDALRALETGEGMDVIQLRSGDHIVVPAQRPPRFTWRMGFEAARTISTLVLLWDRFANRR